MVETVPSGPLHAVSTLPGLYCEIHAMLQAFVRAMDKYAFLIFITYDKAIFIDIVIEILPDALQIC